MPETDVFMLPKMLIGSSHVADAATIARVTCVKLAFSCVAKSRKVFRFDNRRAAEL
jgi:hypothetical protein